ncbi:TetR/AcrR family transcriptional regulator [Ectopseudomonas mendocina]|uniref:TetR/AcrR family transcriptional regulator n=1 Tax=Ectopseudomonas mendocina TaxID=300 RepID=A0ABZ2RQ43_ECTME
MNAAAPTPISVEKPVGRIRQKNKEAIIKAAEEEFARHGFKGTSMNTIAQNVGLPKANLHYYFGNKLDLYKAVLLNILKLWDTSFDSVTAEDDPYEALSTYICAKMEHARRHPKASRIYAMEVISGGEILATMLGQDYRNWFQGRVAVFEAWQKAGKMDPIDPTHLIFMLWSSTQHYADFASQIGRVTGHARMTKANFEQASDNLVHIILKGCGIKLPEHTDALHPA